MMETSILVHLSAMRIVRPWEFLLDVGMALCSVVKCATTETLIPVLLNVIATVAAPVLRLRVVTAFGNAKSFATMDH